MRVLEVRRSHPWLATPNKKCELISWYVKLGQALVRPLTASRLVVLVSMVGYPVLLKLIMCNIERLGIRTRLDVCYSSCLKFVAV